MVKRSGSEIKIATGGYLGYTKMAITLQPINDMFSSQKYYVNPIIKQQIFVLKTVVLYTSLATMALVSDVENSKN